MLELTLPYPPSANRYWRHFQGHTVVSAEAKQYRDEVAWRLLARGVSPLAGPIRVTLHVYRPRKARDLDNCLKVTLDAMQGGAYLSDAQIVELHALRFEDKHDPRIEVKIEEAGQ